MKIEDILRYGNCLIDDEFEEHGDGYIWSKNDPAIGYAVRIRIVEFKGERWYVKQVDGQITEAIQI